MRLLENIAHSIGLRHWIEKNLLKPVRNWKKLTAATSFDAALHGVAHQDAATYAYENFKTAHYFQSKKSLYDFLLPLLKDKKGLCLEFGVFKGATINYFAKNLPNIQWHGFDSFEGLPETWSGTGLSKGAFSLDGKLPTVATNVTLHKGWFDQTAPAFFKNQSTPVDFVHMDADLYSATKTILEAIVPNIVDKTMILFDEYFGQIAWREHEHKAFTEWLTQNEFKAIALAYASNGAVLFTIQK
jgi:hypothetical protein